MLRVRKLYANVLWSYRMAWATPNQEAAQCIPQVAQKPALNQPCSVKVNDLFESLSCQTIRVDDNSAAYR